MKKRTIIKNATIVNEGRIFTGTVIVEDEKISSITEGKTQSEDFRATDLVIDAQGLYLIPGVIDDHVHFREPGLTHKADMESESRAAAAGGVTSFMDMPNVNPLTVTLEHLQEKFELAQQKSRVNYSFFFGATNNNSHLLPLLDKKSVCGVKLFMGSSTGNMLVDKQEALEQLFKLSPLLIMTHCEDSTTISNNLKTCKALYGEDPSVEHHPQIRSAEACYNSSQLAVKLALKTGARLHIAHVTTACELDLFDNKKLSLAPEEKINKTITSEVCIPHLLFDEQDYTSLGTRIKCNPAIKSATDRKALLKALNDGRIDVVGTDHAPHLLSEKKGGCVQAVSGMPMVQFSLVSMLSLTEQGILDITRVVELMCHAPARLFEIHQRGFIREGYQADLVLLKPTSPWTVTPETILSKCGWSPLEKQVFSWRVDYTFCNGYMVYKQGAIDDSYRGQQLIFDR